MRGELDDRAVPAIAIDLPRLLATRLLIQGTSGAGKSWMLRYLLEATHADVQQIVLDREGELVTLRERFPYLLVGPGGDIPADVRSARPLAKKLLELRVSAIVDLSELNLAEQRAFVAEFLGTMAHLPRRYWTDVLVILDEAHLFAPEKGSSVALNAVADLASLGRKRGYCIGLATTRLAKLSKDVSAECGNKLVGRTSADDMKRALEELGAGVTDRTALRSLRDGEFFGYGPAISIDPILVRAGETATKNPARGAARPPSPPAPKQIQDLLGALADLPQQAADESRATEELQARIRTLEAELGSRPVMTPEVQIVERPILRADEVERLQQIPVTIEPLLAQLAAVATVVREAAHQAAAWRHEPPAPVATPRTVAASPRRLPAEVPRVTPSADGVTRPQYRILEALASVERLGVASLSKGAVAVFAEASPRSSAYQNNLGALRSRGLLDYPAPGMVALTEAGRCAIPGGATPVAPTLGDLHAAWAARLPRPQWALLNALIAAYPEPMVREVLAAEAGASPTSSAFHNNLGALRSLGLLDYPTRGAVVATALLFPEGLR